MRQMILGRSYELIGGPLDGLTIRARQGDFQDSVSAVFLTSADLGEPSKQFVYVPDGFLLRYCPDLTAIHRTIVAGRAQ